MLDDDLNQLHEEYYDEDFYEQEAKDKTKIKMTFAEEKEALKKKIKEDMGKKKVVKYKKLPKDILNDPKAPTLDTP
jgi:hypothetical protein